MNHETGRTAPGDHRIEILLTDHEARFPFLRLLESSTPITRAEKDLKRFLVRSIRHELREVG